jgi:hypothetical protein
MRAAKTTDRNLLNDLIPDFFRHSHHHIRTYVSG